VEATFIAIVAAIPK